MLTSESMSVADKMLALLSWRQRVKTGLLILLMVFTAATEAVGIASITPFLAVLADPQIVEKNHYLSRAYALIGSESRDQFLLVLGLLAFAGLVSGTGCRALNSWGQVRFARSLEYGLACRLMTGYLQRPYPFFLARNSADLTKMVLSETSQVVSGFLSPAISIVASLISATFLLALLCIATPALALGATAAIAAIYAAIFFAMRRWLKGNGETRLKANQQRFLAATEVFGGIKEIKLLGNEQVYFRRFSEAFARVARAQANANLAGGLPVYALELMAYGGGLLVALYFLRSSGELSLALPLIALYLLCARRMLPALQNIFKATTQLRYSQPAVNRLLEDFHQTESIEEQSKVSTIGQLPIQHALVLDNVSFTYPQASRPAINNVNLEIPMGARVGFVGATGSGKTTMIDLILGLLTPSSGRLLVDGTPINQGNMRSWQSGLGYVPQHIYLADDTVASNIALGVPERKINQSAVEKAARLACIHDFIVHDMPQGYRTMVGERGVRLSGGQRQRIGVARALYRSPKVLLFDEATSALDNTTEKAVMQGIRALGRERTVIFVAHRLSTVRDCDMIYLFTSGTIAASGTYDELTDVSDEFHAMVRAEAR